MKEGWRRGEVESLCPLGKGFCAAYGRKRALRGAERVLSGDGTVCVERGGEEGVELSCADCEPVYGLVSSGERTVFTGSRDGVIRKYDLPQ